MRRVKRVRGNFASKQVPMFHQNTLHKRHACTLLVHVAIPLGSVEYLADSARQRGLRRPKPQCPQAAAE
jgi:hypothetical protein